MAFKIVISDPKSRKAWQIEKDVPSLFGKKIGEKFDGSLIGLSRFTLQITGGSDKDGFPMRPDLEGIVRKKALLTRGIGFKGFKKIKKKRYKRKGMRKRKYIRGNTISENIVQVNCKVVEGEGDVPTILGIKLKEEQKKEAQKEEKVEEQQPEQKKQEQPKQEEKKEGE